MNSSAYKETPDSISSPSDAPLNLDASGNQAEAPGLLSVVQSVLAAGIGVQSSRKRKRDFEHGRVINFVIVGVVFTALFVGAVVTVVQLVIAK